MTWWGWLLLWTVLVLGAAGVGFLLVRRLWRSTKALTRELAAAADRFSAVADQVSALDTGPEQGGADPRGVGSATAVPPRNDRTTPR